MIDNKNLFLEVVKLEHLFQAWNKFKLGKMHRADVLKFWVHLEDNIFNLHDELTTGTYQHGKYQSFFVFDPKIRHIRKAKVKDRLVHQAVYDMLYQIYEPKFIHHSYAARINKGTHKAIVNLRKMLLKESRNNTETVWALKCDVKKFYDSVDHEILFKLLNTTIKDQRFLAVLKNIIKSFNIKYYKNKGIPIGNLTSQIFNNIYLNELDQYIKHKLRVKYYLRYADDFLLLSQNKEELLEKLDKIQNFLLSNLKLVLHPDKISLRTLKQGIDFVGYVCLPYHTILRTNTKRRMFKKLSKKQRKYYQNTLAEYSYNQSLASYLGILSHTDSKELSNLILNAYLIPDSSQNL